MHFEEGIVPLQVNGRPCWGETAGYCCAVRRGRAFTIKWRDSTTLCVAKEKAFAAFELLQDEYNGLDDIIVGTRSVEVMHVGGIRVREAQKRFPDIEEVAKRYAELLTEQLSPTVVTT